MKLRSLRLDQFRRFDRPMRLDRLGDGVNVLCAPNEFGKSTLLAAIRAVLFERHGSKTASIRSYQPRGNGTAPSVSLRFEHGGATHHIEKRFLLRPQAILRSGEAVFEADAAEDRLATLLGVSAAARGTRDAARQAATVWEALLVDQGQSFFQAELGEGARATLSDCLQAELGAASGGMAIARVLKPVQAQLAERLNGHGRPRDRYRAALAERDQAASDGRALQDRRRALVADLDSLQSARRALGDASDPEAERSARAALLDARRQRDALLGQRDRVAQATGAVELAMREHATLCDERARRAALAEQHAAINRGLSRLRDSETDAKTRLAQAGAALDGARAAHDAAQQAADRAASVLRDARAREERDARVSRHGLLCARLAEAEALRERIDTLSGRLQTLRPDEKGILALRQAALDDRADRAAVLAQATRVSVALLVPATLERPGVADTTLPAGSQQLELTGPARLRIDGVGTVDISPAAGDRDRLLAAAGDSARRLRRGLDASGCIDLADAEARHAERARLLPELAEARRSLGALVGPDGIDALRREEATARPTEVPVSFEGPGVETAQAAYDLAQVAERTARDALGAPDAAREAARTALAEAEAGARAAENEQLRLRAALDQAARDGSEEALADRIGVAERALSAANATLAAILAAAPDGTVALADARIARLEQAAANCTDAQARERERIAGLEARIAAAEGAGLDEQIEAAARREEEAARTVADNEREVAILSLLRSTLVEADRSARERFLRPLVGRIEPTLQALFPGAGVALDERFGVSGLARGSVADAEAFETLSHGTREQVAILCRLAFADMLAAGGHPSLLVLDDALAFADAERMDRMFDILHEAGQRLQILVLTCRADAAARLGGRAVRLLPDGEAGA